MVIKLDMVEPIWLSDEQIRPFIVYALRQNELGFHRLSKSLSDADNDNFHYGIGVYNALVRIVGDERLWPLWDAIAHEFYPDNQYPHYVEMRDYQI